MNNLSQFHPLISRWFTEDIGRPTDVQKEAWPIIAQGEHVLITAPTGSGKTLTAFLWALNQLVTESWPLGRTCVLYVSPLKALNNDIQRNLLTPLSALNDIFRENNVAFPAIHVLTRSGDTSQSERRRMVRHPPEILITTPESLNLMLSSMSGRSILGNLSTVILDEIHAVIGTKRGVHLITAVERLVRLSGEFQRICLSATLRPLETVAQYVGGYRMEGDEFHQEYSARRVRIIHSQSNKKYDIQICSPDDAPENASPDAFWKPYVEAFKNIIKKNKSTLIFANTRRMAEKITLKINSDEDAPIAYAHHGSLSREIRTEVERKLKAGKLKAIVATNSLEMGIDIGALDEVILIQSPPSISSAIQRVGRAGHRVGEVSRATLFPTSSHDLLEAAVLASSISIQDIESVKPVLCPLDVLAQILISMVGIETWDMDALYAQVRTSTPYRHLSRDRFDLVLNMLAGRYADTRIRELKPRLSMDRIDNTVSIRKGALLDLYMSGGMIPDRGYYHLRHNESGSRIGELDEEFVWEAVVGQTFTLGTQKWKIHRITHNDVFVVPGDANATDTPFWKGEGYIRDSHYALKIADFLEDADTRLDDPEFMIRLQNKHCMTPGAASRLAEYLKSQKQTTNADLPHRHHLLIEHVNSGPRGTPGNQLILHTFWGGRVNRPFAMALDAAWEDRFHQRLEIFPGDNCVILVLPEDIGGDELLSLLNSGLVEELLRKRLEGSGFFGARFRECAGRALLITRTRLNQRLPLWMSRIHSQKLLNAVLTYDDFPILLEAWRTSLQDEFDLDALRRMLTEIETNVINVSETYTSHPSPMARVMTWRQINQYMYADDALSSVKTSHLRTDLLRDVVFTPNLRPTVSREMIKQFESKRQRLSPGYSPSTGRDLVDWIKERLLVPESEWKALLIAMRRDHETHMDEIFETASPKLVKISPSNASESLVVSVEQVARIMAAIYDPPDRILIESLDPLGPPIEQSKTFPQLTDEERESIIIDIVYQWLQYYGPKNPSFITESLGIDASVLHLTLKDLLDTDKIISGQLVTDKDEDDLCDAENFEALLRMARADAIPLFEPLDIDAIPLFLATFHGLPEPEEDVDGLYQRLEQLLCYQAPASGWESDILPARLKSYRTMWLDTLLGQSDLRWIGRKNHRVSFCFETDRDLMTEEESTTGDVDSLEQKYLTDDDVKTTFPLPLDIFTDPSARYDFSALLRVSHLSASQLSEKLWNHVWLSQITNDSFQSIRRGIETRFKLPDVLADEKPLRVRSRRSGSRTRFSKWKGSLPYSGNWFLLPQVKSEEDLIEKEERKKDRVRLLLDRYGILFRELLQKEVTPFRWRDLFRSLRIMELSGEILSGYFFKDIPGPQFISHRAFRLLQRALPEDAIYWINAADPVSCCGLTVDFMKENLPRRVDTTHLVYHGRNIVCISKKNGKDITFLVSPDNKLIQAYLCVFNHLLTRTFQPKRRITVETINGERAAKSPYCDILRTHFDTSVDHKCITLYRRVSE